MLFQTLTTVSIFALAALATPLQGAVERKDPNEAAPCPRVIVYGLRGSSENPTATADPAYYNVLPAQFTQIATAAIEKAGGGCLQAIAYPASNPSNHTNYVTSVADGIASLQDTIYDFTHHCATSKIVVLGYSQGAQVMSGALAGSTSRGPLHDHGRVTAGAIFADPAYRDNREPIDQGTGANNGINGVVPGDGSKYDFLNKKYGNRVRSYCQAGDSACDSGTGPDAKNIHLAAPAVFEADAQAFIKELV